MTAFYYYPATAMYHLLYLKELAKTNYITSISGPKIYTKSKIKKEFPEIEPIKKMNGVVMHEGQTIDSRMNLNCLFTASIEDFYPGMKGATLANYCEF